MIAITTIEDSLKGEIKQDFAFLQMLKIAKVSNNNVRFVRFSEIEEDLENLYIGKSSKREKLTIKNQDQYIKEEFLLFYEMEKLEIPLELRQQEYCNSCHQLTIPVPEKKFKLQFPFFHHTLCCEHCKSEDLKLASLHFVQKKIIDQFKAGQRNS